MDFASLNCCLNSKPDMFGIWLSKQSSGFCDTWKCACRITSATNVPIVAILRMLITCAVVLGRIVLACCKMVWTRYISGCSRMAGLSLIWLFHSKVHHVLWYAPFFHIGPYVCGHTCGYQKPGSNWLEFLQSLFCRCIWLIVPLLLV